MAARTTSHHVNETTDNRKRESISIVPADTQYTNKKVVTTTVITHDTTQSTCRCRKKEAPSHTGYDHTPVPSAHEH